MTDETKDLWSDLETYSEVPIKNGTHAYAEGAEVMVWAFADGDGEVYVWDLVNSMLHWVDELSGVWVEESIPYGLPPVELDRMIDDHEYQVWFQNGGMFDFVVLKHALPDVLKRIPLSRWRDTMVQAFSHALPGSLDKLGAALRLNEDDKKDGRGKALIRLFCMPQNDAFFEKFGTRRATKQTHPNEWQEFIEYAGGDITTMRAVHRKIPKWNYRDKQVALWHTDMVINNRGFKIDRALAEAAIRAVEETKGVLAARTKELTNGEVESATKRDQMLAYILGEFGVELPDMRSDTLERRLQDDDLPDAVRELIKIRLLASMNSVSKYKTAIKAANRDGRIRGGAQFRGAGRTGRYAHRLFQHGNMPRPTISQYLIELGIRAVKVNSEALCMVLGAEYVMNWASSAIRSLIIAEEGHTLAVADLSNIEGRVAAWLAGEEWKLDAFRNFDAGIGPDLYILAYANSFNVPPESVPKKGDERQIGKVEELMFQYGGGVGAWLTGAATYSIDLDKMTDQVFPVLPGWAVEEAMDYLKYLHEQAETKNVKAISKWGRMLEAGLVSPEVHADEVAKQEAKHLAAVAKLQMGLPYRTFITCDAIKRLWRRAHPMISSYWKELEETVREAVAHPKTTFTCRKVKIRRSGGWLRIALPSGRELTYPEIEVSDSGEISYVGPNTYTRKWGRIKTYGGKIFENIVQAVAADQLMECFPLIEAAGFNIIFHVHDETATEVPLDSGLDHKKLAQLMCSDLGWNHGLPLAAAGFTAPRYKKD